GLAERAVGGAAFEPGGPHLRGDVLDGHLLAARAGAAALVRVGGELGEVAVERRRVDLGEAGLRNGEGEGGGVRGASSARRGGGGGGAGGETGEESGGGEEGAEHRAEGRVERAR